MTDFVRYRRTNIAEMRPYIPGEDLTSISVSNTDDPETDHGMVARNPNNHADQWYVARQYFNENFEPIDAPTTNEQDNPDYLYDPDDWEITFEWKDRDELVECIEPEVGDVITISTLYKGPDLYLVNVVKKRDEEGYADETEIQWFKTKEEAEEAAKL